MADTMQFDLVSPERRLVSVAAKEVHLPGTEGDLTAMPDHAPLITTLRPGVVSVTTSEGTSKYVVTGGFADIGPDKVSILAERALPQAEVTRAVHDDLVKEAEAALTKARETHVNEPGPVDDAAKLLADMVAVGDQIRID